MPARPRGTHGPRLGCCLRSRCQRASHCVVRQDGADLVGGRRRVPADPPGAYERGQVRRMEPRWATPGHRRLRSVDPTLEPGRDPLPKHRESGQPDPFGHVHRRLPRAALHLGRDRSCSFGSAVLQVSSGQERLRFTKHDNTVNSGAISPDGTVAATAGGSSTRNLPLETGGRLRSFHRLAGKGHASLVRRLEPGRQVNRLGQHIQGHLVERQRPPGAELHAGGPRNRPIARRQLSAGSRVPRLPLPPAHRADQPRGQAAGRRGGEDCSARILTRRFSASAS